MRHSQLKAFHHVALLGGFSRAAEALFLTQPAISEQVKKLEQAYDTLLFHRQRRNVKLTQAGQRLFLYTKQYFEIETQLKDLLSSSSASIEGELRIVADSTHHVTHFLGEFLKNYPNISVVFRTENTEKALEELRAYNAEIGIVGSLSPGNDMEMLSLGSTRIMAFAARETSFGQQSSLSLQELTALPLIFREQGSKTRQKLEECAKSKGVTLTPVIVAEGREAVREIVASGAGIGFVSQAEFGHDNRLVQIGLADAGIEMSEAVVHLRQRRDVRVIQAFMDFAKRAQKIDETGGKAGAS